MKVLENAGSGGSGVEAIRQFMLLIAGAVIEQRDDLQVEVERIDDLVDVSLVANRNAVGKLIGKRGTVALSLRTLSAAAGAKLGVRVSLNIRAFPET